MVFCVAFIDYCLSFCLFSLGHCAALLRFTVSVTTFVTSKLSIKNIGLVQNMHGIDETFIP